MENINWELVDWQREQFAQTAIYHWFFVPLTLGLSFIIAMMESICIKPVTLNGNELHNFG